eukprot:2783176-Prymnesium_polylepis.1
MASLPMARMCPDGAPGTVYALGAAAIRTRRLETGDSKLATQTGDPNWRPDRLYWNLKNGTEMLYGIP